MQHDDTRDIRTLRLLRVQQTSHSSFEAASEVTGGRAALGFRRFRRSVEVDVCAPMANERFDQIRLYAGGVGKAVNQQRARRKRALGIDFHGFPGLAKPLGAVGHSATEDALTTSRDGDHGTGSIAEIAPYCGCFEACTAGRTSSIGCLRGA